jgi:hypothetical protein
VSHIEARIEGDVGGQIAVGTHIVQVKAEQGAAVTVVAPEEAPEIRAVTPPVYVRPRDFPDLLDRHDEARSAEASLRRLLPVELYGPPGSGKTSLLRHIAYSIDAVAFPAGIICLPTLRTASDLVQALFDALFEADIRIKPTEMQIRRLLADLQALVLVDDVELGGADLDELLDAAPRCAFLLCSSERRLWRDGRALAVGGLPTEEAMELVGIELGRTLDESERDAARQLSVLLDGYPLRIRQAVALARDEGRPLADLAAELQGGAAASERRVLLALSSEELSVVRALALAGQSSFPEEWVGALSGIRDPSGVLASLERRGVVESLSPRYRLLGSLGEEVLAQEDLGPEIERAAAFAELEAERSRDAPERLADAAEALVATADLAAARDRPQHVLRLARALDATLLLTGRWGAWRRILMVALEAARRLGDPGAEGWATHQLGSRALALGDAAGAGELLARALSLREQAGDAAGAALTRQNAAVASSSAPTSVLPPTAAAEPEAVTPRRGWRQRFSLPQIGIGALVLAGAGAAGFAVGTTNTGDGKPVAIRSVTVPVTVNTEVTRDVTVERTITAPGATRTVEVTGKVTVTQQLATTVTREVTLKAVTVTSTATVTVNP